MGEGGREKGGGGREGKGIVRKKKVLPFPEAMAMKVYDPVEVTAATEEKRKRKKRQKVKAAAAVALCNSWSSYMNRHTKKSSFFPLFFLLSKEKNLQAKILGGVELSATSRGEISKISRNHCTVSRYYGQKTLGHKTTA